MWFFQLKPAVTEPEVKQPVAENGTLHEETVMNGGEEMKHEMTWHVSSHDKFMIILVDLSRILFPFFG